jgi:hypothetical protein
MRDLDQGLVIVMFSTGAEVAQFGITVRQHSCVSPVSDESVPCWCSARCGSASCFGICDVPELGNRDVVLRGIPDVPKPTIRQ